MSNLDNLVAEILQQAQKEANRILAKIKAENLEFTEKENKKIQREVDVIEQKSKEEAISLKERILSNAWSSSACTGRSSRSSPSRSATPATPRSTPLSRPP